MQSKTGLAGAPPEVVPARMVNEVLYCERLLYLEFAQGEWADNQYTVDGRWAHRRTDVESGDLEPTDDNERPQVARSVWLTSERLGLTAKIDVVEAEGGRVVPIEYKRGKAPDVPEGAYLPERAQLCAQVLLLREQGFACDEAAIYFVGSRRRVPIQMDDALSAVTLDAITKVRAVTARGTAPPPLVDSSKCDGCSLVGICLPDEVHELCGEPALDQTKAIRRLHPARDDRLPLYVQEQGARIGLNGEVLVVKGKDAKSEARLPDTSQVCLFGNVQISTQAIRSLAERDVPLFFFTYGGWFTARVLGLDGKNVELRVAQYQAAANEALCLQLAQTIVSSKIRNQRTMLRRNHESVDPVVLSHLEQLAKKAEQADSLPTLLGLEGTAARDYFGAFSGMLKGAGVAFDLEGRNRRPPRDPVNALLSFVYGLLTKDLVLAVTSVGLDPMLGVYHQPRFGRPALALDLMEELRAIVADSVVVNALNTGIIKEEDFVRQTGACALAPAARKRLIAAYERRMQQEIQHPVFGYSVSWRRTLEVQARLLAKLFLGEVDRYVPVRTR